MYKRKKVPTPISKKGKGVLDEEFETERQWLVDKILADNPTLSVPEPEVEVSVENGVDCGCCFSPALVVRLLLSLFKTTSYCSYAGEDDSMSRRSLILPRLHVHLFVHSPR